MLKFYCKVYSFVVLYSTSERVQYCTGLHCTVCTTVHYYEQSHMNPAVSDPIIA